MKKLRPADRVRVRGRRPIRRTRSTGQRPVRRRVFRHAPSATRTTAQASRGWARRGAAADPPHLKACTSAAAVRVLGGVQNAPIREPIDRRADQCVGARNVLGDGAFRLRRLGRSARYATTRCSTSSSVAVSSRVTISEPLCGFSASPIGANGASSFVFRQTSLTRRSSWSPTRSTWIRTSTFCRSALDPRSRVWSSFPTWQSKSTAQPSSALTAATARRNRLISSAWFSLPVRSTCRACRPRPARTGRRRRVLLR